MNKKPKFLLLIYCLFLIVFLITPFISGIITYNTMFNRVEIPNYNTTPGLINYDDISSLYPRLTYHYKSKKNTLCGYFYPNNNAKAMIVMSHGYNQGADSLLSTIIYFLENDYCVFAYDNSGCHNSSGKMKGFNQSVIDLESTLNFINSNNDLSIHKLLLFGFSLGGYATTSIFNILNNNIYGSVSVSGFNDAKNIFFDIAYMKVNIVAYLGKSSMELINLIKFNKYSSLTSLDGINKVNIPIFIAHSVDDELITYNKLSIISNKNKITNPNVTYYSLKDKTHGQTLYSYEAINYQKKVVDETIEASLVDDYLYSQIDNDLFNQILLFYSSCINKKSF